MNKQHPLYREDLKHIIASPAFKFLHGKRILVTGATGLIGCCLIDAIMYANQSRADITVYAVGRSREKASSRFGEYYDNDKFVFLVQDVRHPLPEELKVDIIVPLASNTHPLAYSQFPIETIEINVKGAEFALTKAIECGATVLYPSTVEVYGNARGQDYFTEDYTGSLNLSNARSCYTESKRLSESLCQSFIAERGADVKIARLSRIFGPTMLKSDTKASSQFILKALKNEDIVLKSEGKQYFSYTYVADAVLALLYVLAYGVRGQAYNISNVDCNMHLKDFAEYCASWANKSVVFDLPDEVERKGYSVASQAILDNSRLLHLGWQPHYPAKDAIERTLKILTN